ncbi:MAG: hypothetical protein ACHQSE_07265 [Gemmatimonadales bacterium]
MYRRAVPAAVSLALLAACRSGTIPNQVLTKPAPVRAALPVARSTTGHWAYRPSTVLQRFTVDQHAAITVGVDSTARTDTVSSHAEVAFTNVPSTHELSGTVSALLVAGGGRIAATPPGLQVPFPFRATYPGANLQLQFAAPADVTPCSSTALAAVQSLRDLWFQAPDTLRVGSTWSDSSSYVTCRDGIALRATVHRMFHVTASKVRDGRMLLSITRLSRTLVDGHGTQFGDSVTVSGAGNGQLTYDVDPSSGEIASANGSATLDFSLRSSQRTQIVRQVADILIGRR